MKQRRSINPLVTVLMLLGAIVAGYFVFLLLGAFIPGAYAGTATLSWKAPTTNADGSSLTDLAGFKIYYAVDGGPVTVQPVASPTAVQYTFPTLGPGLWAFDMTAYNSKGTESVHTASVTKAIAAPPPPPPSAPVALQVGATTVYTLVKKRDGFLLLPVGSAPAGTICIATESVNGYYVVPRAAVDQWSGSVKPEVVVAPCQ
jgi:hypothetical protein